jgi:hypothetical protein
MFATAKATIAIKIIQAKVVTPEKQETPVEAGMLRYAYSGTPGTPQQEIRRSFTQRSHVPSSLNGNHTKTLFTAV